MELLTTTSCSSCIGGSEAPEPCRNGTFNSLTRQSNLSACQVLTSCIQFILSFLNCLCLVVFSRDVHTCSWKYFLWLLSIWLQVFRLWKFWAGCLLRRTVRCEWDKCYLWTYGLLRLSKGESVSCHMGFAYAVWIWYVWKHVIFVDVVLFVVF